MPLPLLAYDSVLPAELCEQVLTSACSVGMAVQNLVLNEEADDVHRI